VPASTAFWQALWSDAVYSIFAADAFLCRQLRRNRSKTAMGLG
jgi:hypothetical protein